MKKKIKKQNLKKDNLKKERFKINQGKDSWSYLNSLKKASIISLVDLR